MEGDLAHRVIEGLWKSAKTKRSSSCIIFQESLVSSFIASKRFPCPKKCTGSPVVSITLWIVGVCSASRTVQFQVFCRARSWNALLEEISVTRYCHEWPDKWEKCSPLWSGQVGGVWPTGLLCSRDFGFSASFLSSYQVVLKVLPLLCLLIFCFHPALVKVLWATFNIRNQTEPV